MRSFSIIDTASGAYPLFDRWIFTYRGLMFVKNNFGGVIPEMQLREDESELLALITKELKAYIGNLEKIKCVLCTLL